MPFRLFLNVNEYGEPIRLPISELADDNIAIRLSLDTFPVFLAALKLSLVLTTISPFHFTFAVDLALLELPNKCLIFLFEVVSAHSLEQSIHKVALIVRPIIPHKLALSVLFALLEHALVRFQPVVPDLSAVPVLLIIHPMALVPAPIQVLEHALSVRLPSMELAHVELSVRKDLAALPVRVIALELTFILCSIRPKHDTYSVSNSLMFQPIYQNNNEYSPPKKQRYHSPL